MFQAKCALFILNASNALKLKVLQEMVLAKENNGTYFGHVFARGGCININNTNNNNKNKNIIIIIIIMFYSVHIDVNI